MADSSIVSIKLTLVDEVSGAVRTISGQMNGLSDSVREVVDNTTSASQRLADATNNLFKWSLLSDALRSLSDSLGSLIAPSVEFEDSLRRANTMAGLSEDEFQAMKQSIRALSQEIPMSAAALSDGLYAVVSNGVDAADQLEVLRASARAAVGGCADLSRVVGVSATIMKNYGLSGADVASIQDKIQLTARNGVTSFEELAAALPSVTANAATLGVSIDELLASYATLTGVSGNTSAVSTQLGAIFSALAKPTSEASKLAQQMGVQFDAAAIKAAGGMQNFLASLSDDIDQYAARSGMLRETIVATLFGSAEAVKAFTPITGELATKFAENVQTMHDSAGTIDEAFAQMEQTSGARLQSIQNFFGQFTDYLQDKFGGVVSMTGAVLSGFGQFSAALPTFQMLGSLIQRTGIASAVTSRATAAWTAVQKAWNATTAFGRNLMTATIARLNVWRAAIAKTVVWQKIAAVATKAWAAAQAAFNFIASLNPIGLLIAGITLLVGAIAACIYWFDSWGETVLMCMGPVGSLIASIVRHWDSLKRAFTDGGFIAGLYRIGEVLMDVVLAPMQKLLSWVAELTGWDWAKAASQWVHDVRVDHNLTEGETETEGEKKDEKKENPLEAALESAPSSASGATTSLGIGAATAATPSVATAQSGGQIKRVDINIDSVVREFTVSTSNLQQSASDIRDLVARALLDAVNDVNYAI